MDWWTNAETFHASSAAYWATLAEGKFTFTTHCPIDKNYIDRAHQWGIRCFPYVSFYFGADQCKLGTITSNTYEGVDFSQHPDFWQRDPQGRPKPWVFTPGTGDGIGVTFSNPPLLNPPSLDPPYETCPNYEGYQEAMLAWVQYIMQQGADGIFVDNILRRTHCYADPNKDHKHIYPDDHQDPDLAQNQAFELLLQRARQTVKAYKPDGLLIGNSGDPLQILKDRTWPGFQQYLDADTLEGYVETPSWANGTRSWADLGKQLQAYLAQGKQVLAISNPLPGDREAAFRAYGAARLAGLTWYGAPNGVADPLNDPAVADLHRVRLGTALAPEAIDPASQIHYRVFQRGIVAVNWDPPNSNAKSFPGRNIAAAALATSSQNVQFFCDLFTSLNSPPAIVDTGTSSGMLQVPANSGRVFLYGSSFDYGLNRTVTPPPVQPQGQRPRPTPPATHTRQ